MTLSPGYILFDLSVLDDSILTIIKPKFPVISGSERMDEQVRRCRFHFVGLLTGRIDLALMSVVVAFLMTLL